jgi:prevent-host-death family protein
VLPGARRKLPATGGHEQAEAIYVVTYLHRFDDDTGAPMTITTLSSREFNQDASGAKRAASNGPVFITDRGRPAHVLLTIEAYQSLANNTARIADLLAMPGVEDIGFEPPRMGSVYRPADLS